MTYTELLTAITLYSKRTDLAAMLPTFIELAETRLNRFLRVREMEGSVGGTISPVNELALPADFGSMKAIWAVGYERSRLQPQTLETVIGTGRISGVPMLYAVTSSALRLDGTGDVLGVYFKRLPALATNGSNWLSTAHPDAYLFTALSELHAYVQDATQTAFYDAKAREVMDAIQKNDMRDRFSGQLTAKAS
jgi:hypothetical protein